MVSNHSLTIITKYSYILAISVHLPLNSCHFRIQIKKAPITLNEDLSEHKKHS